MSPKLKIMVQAIDGVGHVNACLGVAEKLQLRGHKIIFVIFNASAQLLQNHRDRFTVEILDNYNDCSDKADSDSKPGSKIAETLHQLGVISKGTSYEKYHRKNNYSLIDKSKLYRQELRMKELVEKYRPDLFIQDNFCLSPFVQYSNRPWVRLISNTPTYYDEIDGIPPGGSGYPVDGDQSEWEKFRKLVRFFFHKKEYNEVVQELGFEPYPNDHKLPSTYALTLFAYPKELTYWGVFEYPENWINVESFMRENKYETFQVPESLQLIKDKYPGKLIYFSLGSMASVDVELMKRFVEILSKTKHRYIVSKGPRHTEFELTENMWGDRYLPQTQILPVVDLVITHGGNNTFTETLLFGKPMIVFPMFVDQFDNAQRITEVGLGRRIDPYDFDDQQLIDSIDQLLGDNEINERLRKMSQRIQSMDRFKVACDRIEALVVKD